MNVIFSFAFQLNRTHSKHNSTDVFRSTFDSKSLFVWFGLSLSLETEWKLFLYGTNMVRFHFYFVFYRHLNFCHFLCKYIFFLTQIFNFETLISCSRLGYSRLFLSLHLMTRIIFFFYVLYRQLIVVYIDV